MTVSLVSKLDETCVSSCSPLAVSINHFENFSHLSYPQGNQKKEVSFSLDENCKKLCASWEWALLWWQSAKWGKLQTAGGNSLGPNKGQLVRSASPPLAKKYIYICLHKQKKLPPAAEWIKDKVMIFLPCILLYHGVLCSTPL